MDDDIPYLLLTPGPLTTSRAVREAMLHDYSTWDVDYNALVNETRGRIVRIATPQDGYTSVLIQGSGTFAVEATIGSVVPTNGKILVVVNGAYGQRMVQIAQRLKIDYVAVEHAETESPQLDRVESALTADPTITHLAMVHCETTTGILNPASEVGRLAARFEKDYILDAMSSFGGVPLEMAATGATYLVSSSNKCIQGVPGFGFVIAVRSALEGTRGWARSLSLDLYGQWDEMERNQGKWRYTSPTHSLCAFIQALNELDLEGGVAARHKRYSENQRRLVQGMRELGFETLLPDALQSPIITAFRYPVHPGFDFAEFYNRLKSRRFVIYPGKVTATETFRIGSIGHVFPLDIDLLIKAVGHVASEMGLRAG